MRQRVLLFLFLFAGFASRAQTPVLLKDLSIYRSNGIFRYCATDDKVFFVFNDELWVTDLTTAGTQPLIKFSPYNYTSFINLHNTLYFISGQKLWKSDGTISGTTVVGTGYNVHKDEDELTVFNNQLIFTATDGIHGNELWISDGTSQGTRMFLDFDKNSYLALSIPRCVTGSKLIFSGNDSTSATDYYPDGMWETDASGSVKKICDTPGYDLFSYNDVVYFIGEPVDTPKLFFGKYDVHTAAIGILADSVYAIDDYQIVNSHIVLLLSDMNSDRYLYAIDSFGNNFTQINTIGYTDINEGRGPLRHFAKSGIEVFLLERAGASPNLWKSDGTVAGTQKITTPDSLILRGYLTGTEKGLFLKAYDTTAKRIDLFKMDASGTFNAITYPSAWEYPWYSATFGRIIAPGTIFSFGHHLLFTNDYDSATGNELYMVDFTPASVTDYKRYQATLFPNPATDYIHILEPSAAEVTLFDNTGRKIVATNEREVAVMHLRTGTYIVAIRLKDGTYKYATFIKQ